MDGVVVTAALEVVDMVGSVESGGSAWSFSDVGGNPCKLSISPMFCCGNMAFCVL